MPSVRRNRKYHGQSAATIWPAEYPKHSPQHAKKDTRHWCKGVEGREHAPKIVVYYSYHAACRPSRYFSEHWQCRHAEICTVCLKVLRHGWSKDFPCPDRK